jgi:hypothetical protein
MNTPNHYAEKAKFFENVRMFSSAAVLYRMAANAAPRNKRALSYRGAAKRCEAQKAAA